MGDYHNPDLTTIQASHDRAAKRDVKRETRVEEHKNERDQKGRGR